MAKHVAAAVVAAMLAMAAGSALADDPAQASQPAKHEPVMRGPMGMLAELNLTDDQKAKIKDIFAAAKAQAEQATDPKDKLGAFKAALDTIHKDVLTDDQRKLLEDLKAKGEQLRQDIRQRPAAAAADKAPA